MIGQPGASGQKPPGSNSIKPTAKSATIAAKGQKLSSKDRIPLIIVPAAPTAKFTLYNIKQFLEDQAYVFFTHLASERETTWTDGFYLAMWIRKY